MGKFFFGTEDLCTKPVPAIVWLFMVAGMFLLFAPSPVPAWQTVLWGLSAILVVLKIVSRLIYGKPPFRNLFGSL